MTTYIIARYNEDVSWCDDFDTKFIVQKDVHLPNKGREASSYLWYIINNYNALTGLYEFRQGKTSDHPISDFIIKSDLKGSPFHRDLKIKELSERLSLNIPDKLIFTPGAQFYVTTEQIKQRSLEWYINAYNLSISDEFDNVAHIFERLWKYIFNL
jgi:hypothetical protein